MVGTEIASLVKSPQANRRAPAKINNRIFSVLLFCGEKRGFSLKCIHQVRLAKRLLLRLPVKLKLKKRYDSCAWTDAGRSEVTGSFLRTRTL